MSELTRNFAAYLEAAGFGTFGTDIFVGQIPSDTNGIYIVDAGGSLNNYVPIVETVLDIYVKDIKAETGIAKLNNIKNFIHRMHNTTIDDSYIYTFLVIGDIEDIQRDVEYAKIYKITLQVVHRDTTLIS